MITLLSTDFDWTVVDHDSKPTVDPAFLEAMVDLKKRGALWAVNTGRELEHIVEGLRDLPVEPDYVLTVERQVFHRGPGGQWQDYGDWNARCAQVHASLFDSATVLLADIQEFLTTHVKAHLIHEGGHLVGLVADSEEEMERVCEFLDRERGRVPGFQYMRNSIYARFCHEAFNKGTALGELSRLLGLSPDLIFAAGDHYNDIPMLDGSHAQWVACPSNAVEAVKTTVRRVGGHVATKPCSSGLVQALQAFGAI